MKVIHLPFCFHPDSMGGTEVYVTGLAKELSRRNVENVISAPSTSTNSYDVDGIRVRRFATSQNFNDPSMVYGEGDDLAALEFARVLDDDKPNIVHLHAFTSAISLKIVRAAKLRGIPVVYTYHTPTATCARGTMMRWGTEPCDGVMSGVVCAGCKLEGLFKEAVGGRATKLGKTAARIMGRVPPVIGQRINRYGLRGKPWTMLRMPDLVQLRHATTRAMLDEVDHVVSVCEWVHQMLLRNGVPSSKMTLSRQGVSEFGVRRTDDAQVVRSSSSVLRICFLGRLDPTKGVHIILEALRASPLATLRFDIYGVAQGKSGATYERMLRALVYGDTRVNFLPPVSPIEVPETLRKYDFLVVPSQWLETGPLVVLEAFDAGIPVIGARLGGIAELVVDGVNGILVDPASISEWKKVFEMCCRDTKFVARLRSGVTSPRKMRTVADEMHDLYQKLLSPKN
jgi:glycosyltransferase involved in cell wall biosynthesis